MNNHPKINRKKWLLVLLGLALGALYWSWPRDLGRDFRLAVFEDDHAKVEKMLHRHPELVNLANVPSKKSRVQSRPRPGTMNFMEELTMFIWEKVFLGPIASPNRGNDFADIEEAGLPPLQIAVIKGNWEITRLLLEHAAEVKVSSYGGYHPIHFAASQQPEFVELLLQHGADPNATNQYGATPLHMGIHNSQQKTLELLLKAGSNPNARNRNGATPLHNAISSHDSTNVLWLLWQHGARADITNRQGHTALDLAHRYNRSNAVEFLTARPVSQP